MKNEKLGLKSIVIMPRFIVGCLSAVLILATTALSSYSAPSEWKPEKNVELIVGTSAGGGTDQQARIVQMLFHTKGLVKPSSTVVNKPGGGQTIGQTYLKQHAGDGHYIMFTSNTLFTNNILGLTPIRYTDFTPIALLGIEPVFFMVRADSPIKTGKDLIERFKKDPKSLSIAISNSRGNHNHLAPCLVMKSIGEDPNALKIVIVNSTGESVTGLLGGHFDLVPSMVSAFMELIKAGKVRAIAVASEERVGGALANVPTWKEQGVDAVSSNIRAVIGPKGMSQAQIAYWDDKFSKLTKLQEWKKFMEKKSAELMYLDSKKTKKFFDDQHKKFKEILTDLGLAK